MYSDRLLLLMLIISSHFQSVMPMNHDVRRTATDDVLINIGPLPSPRYSESINKMPQTEGLKRLRSDLVKKQFLPSNASSLEQLLYLSTINKDDKSKSLFTYAQQKKFDEAEGIKRWVRRCFVINAGVIIATALTPFTSAMSFLQCADENATHCLSSKPVILSPATISWFGALIVGFSSLYATGISPDLSARKADKVQDEIGDLHNRYATMAKHLVDIYFDDPQKGKDIVAMFDIAELKERAQAKTYRNKIGGNLISSLEEACNFIKTGNVLSQFTAIENYIRTEVNRKGAEADRKWIEALEKTIREQQNKKSHIKKRNKKHETKK
jgi:hypothetical protein